jgi:hypothetical protein
MQLLPRCAQQRVLCSLPSDNGLQSRSRLLKQRQVPLKVHLLSYAQYRCGKAAAASASAAASRCSSTDSVHLSRSVIRAIGYVDALTLISARDLLRLHQA